MRILHLPNSWKPHAIGTTLLSFECCLFPLKKSIVTTKWFVHKDAVEGVDYDPENLRKVWECHQRTRQGYSVNVISFGINSIGYRPGPYSETFEFGVINF